LEWSLYKSHVIDAKLPLLLIGGGFVKYAAQSSALGAKPCSSQSSLTLGTAPTVDDYETTEKDFAING